MLSMLKRVFQLMVAGFHVVKDSYAAIICLRGDAGHGAHPDIEGVGAAKLMHQDVSLGHDLSLPSTKSSL